MLIRQKDKEALDVIFDSITQPVEIWAFGSRVSGSAHQGSDLDLVVRNYDLGPVPNPVFNDLVEKVRESNIPILIDLLDWAKIPESFHRNIESNHEVIFDNRLLILNDPKTPYIRPSKD